MRRLLRWLGFNEWHARLYATDIYVAVVAFVLGVAATLVYLKVHGVIL